MKRAAEDFVSDTGAYIMCKILSSENEISIPVLWLLFPGPNYFLTSWCRQSWIKVILANENMRA